MSLTIPFGMGSPKREPIAYFEEDICFMGNGLLWQLIVGGKTWKDWDTGPEV